VKELMELKKKMRKKDQAVSGKRMEIPFQMGIIE
jgi:hypothetical protein